MRTIMGTESESPSRSALITRAWELSTQQGLSTRAVAAEMGIPHSTARDYIKRGQNAEGFIDLLDRAEARLAQAHRLAGYLTRLEAVMEAEPNRTVEVINAIKWVEERWAKLGGLDAPMRIQNETSSAGAEMNPEIIAAIAEAKAKADANIRQIRGESE